MRGEGWREKGSRVFLLFFYVPGSRRAYRGLAKILLPPSRRAYPLLCSKASLSETCKNLLGQSEGEPIRWCIPRRAYRGLVSRRACPLVYTKASLSGTCLKASLSGDFVCET